MARCSSSRQWALSLVVRCGSPAKPPASRRAPSKAPKAALAQTPSLAQRPARPAAAADALSQQVCEVFQSDRDTLVALRPASKREILAALLAQLRDAVRARASHRRAFQVLRACLTLHSIALACALNLLLVVGASCCCCQRVMRTYT